MEDNVIVGEGVTLSLSAGTVVTGSVILHNDATLILEGEVEIRGRLIMSTDGSSFIVGGVARKPYLELPLPKRREGWVKYQTTRAGKLYYTGSGL